MTHYMIAERFPELDDLTLEEKRLLAAELLDEVEPGDEVLLEDMGVSPELAAAIEKRIAFNMAHPEEFRTWEQVVDRIKGKPDA